MLIYIESKNRQQVPSCREKSSTVLYQISKMPWRSMFAVLPNSQNSLIWEPATDSVHESSTNTTKIVLHGIPCCNSIWLLEFRQLVLSFQMFKTGILNDEVAREHASRDFTAVSTIAYECVNQIRLFSGEFETDSTAITCCCRTRWRDFCSAKRKVSLWGHCIESVRASYSQAISDL